MSGNTYTGPPLAAAWLDAGGAQLGTGSLSALTDAGQYLYHASRFRVGDRGTPMPAGIRIAAPNGDVATLAVKRWTDGSGTTSPGGFIQDFVTHYVTPREAYEKVRLLSSEFPDTAEAAAAAEQDQRLSAQGADRDRQRHALHGPVDDRQPELGRRPDLGRLGPRGRRAPDRRDRAPAPSSP